jgi:hypothetical protein
MHTRRPAVIRGSRARTARRVPGRWCSGRVPAYVREAGRYWKIFAPRLRCGVSHALLPAFTLAWRLDVAETIGSVAREVVVGGGCGSAQRGSGRGCRIRPPAAGSAGSGPAAELGVACGGGGGGAGRAGGHAPGRGGGRFALTAVGAAFAAAPSLRDGAGWAHGGSPQR